MVDVGVAMDDLPGAVLAAVDVRDAEGELAARAVDQQVAVLQLDRIAQIAALVGLQLGRAGLAPAKASRYPVEALAHLRPALLGAAVAQERRNVVAVRPQRTDPRAVALGQAVQRGVVGIHRLAKVVIQRHVVFPLAWSGPGRRHGLPGAWRTSCQLDRVYRERRPGARLRPTGLPRSLL